jgi:hypothetical protein
VQYRGQSITIAFQIGDAWDDAFDSAAFIDNLRITRGDAASLNGAAANLAKELVNSAYLYGGKGWDFNVHEFIAPNTIKNGYNFWNQGLPTPGVDFGTGVDCSGLIMWAYNHSFDPNKSRFNNFVKVESADEQFRENTELITEAELQPGDVMFFDNVPKDNFIDHVAMYVGESGGYDVVSAVNRATGIVPRLKDNLKQPGAGFVAFKRVISALPPPVLIAAHSPVNLIVTDPDGFTITPETIIPSELEFLREIPGVLYYSEMEQGADGRPIDQVYSYIAKTGDYLISVLPESGALPTETFTLSFTTDLSTTTILAENIPIADIPSQPYRVRISDNAVEKIIPATINIAPTTLNLGQEGLFSAIVKIEKGFGASVADVDLETIAVQGVPATRIIVRDTFIVAFFDTQKLENVELGKNTKLQLVGKLKDGTTFEGSDTISVISNGRLSSTLGQFNQLASVLSALQSVLIQLRGLLEI